ncbi:hypothetical protein LWF01_00980 [Saxibacter everestensis]|uniref:Uncharacterized protein n=1 Tax=Saxibacter everestensis TaxID=2909229 RepID=A0ABY8QTS0_9MICO|nr:hypothetical protein LWF01_00980 [Brevibacteriaceae bacterium ZFBP1038]
MNTRPDRCRPKTRPDRSRPKRAREAPERSDRVARKQIYVEILIRSSKDRIFELSQNTELHPRWDLRFSSITPIEQASTPAGDDDSSNAGVDDVSSNGGSGNPGNNGTGGLLRFRYAFRLPFHTISGTGTSIGNNQRADGQATSVLKFTTDDWLSPIGPGAGYWRYIPTADGVRFLTGYNYEPGMGRIGKLLDSRVIRPALGWATALSFDRLRLWAESGIDPAKARSAWLVDATSRAALLASGIGLISTALRSRRRVFPIAAGVTAMTAAFTLPTPPAVPRAGRCLRRPPDTRSGRAPDGLATLADPGISIPSYSEPRKAHVER